MVNKLVRRAEKPSIVIVPGSFSPSSFYSTIVDNLSENGYEALASDLPSASRVAPAPAATMEEDAAHFHAIASKLAGEGKQVVLVSHSYGGIVGTECAKGLAKATREAAGTPGGIVRLIYLTAVVPPVGESLKSFLGDHVPTYINVEGEYMSHEVMESGRVTFSDLPLAEGVEWAKRMTKQSARSFIGELTYAAYKHISVSYIVCEADAIIPPTLQRQMIDRITEESGNQVDVLSLDSGHCPNASRPHDVARLIREALSKTTIGA